MSEAMQRRGSREDRRTNPTRGNCWVHLGPDRGYVRLRKEDVDSAIAKAGQIRDLPGKEAASNEDGKQAAGLAGAMRKTLPKPMTCEEESILIRKRVYDFIPIRLEEIGSPRKSLHPCEYLDSRKAAIYVCEAFCQAGKETE